MIFTESGLELYGLELLPYDDELLKNVRDFDNFGQVSLPDELDEQLSVLDAVSFMKQICKFIPVKRSIKLRKLLQN